MLLRPSTLQRCSTLLLLLRVAAATGAPQKPAPEYDAHHDALVVARCEARCPTKPCVKSCLLNGWRKPGDCPRTTSSPFASVCLNTCKDDKECPDVGKCCAHQCGVTCQQPQNLDNIDGIPQYPSEITVRGKRKRSLYIKWKPEVKSRSPIIYVIEERHHTGKYFVENHMGEWNYCHRTSKHNAILKHIVKPGRWYQFRVAAVNENGTKGYSEPIGYVAQAGPRPPKAPQNMVAGPLWILNGTLNTELKWTPPQSDLPIQRYKVFWSRRLHGATALDSVLVLQQTVTKDPTKCVIRDLEPDSLYFLQVQALAQFGKDTLRGEKSGLVLNTTNYTNISESTQSIAITPKVENLQLQKLFWSQGDLKARIVWKQKKEGVKHTVSWWSGPCKNGKGQSHFKLAATTKSSHYDIYDLHFECRYRVDVRETSNEGMRSIYDTSITFTTPACRNMQGKSRKVKCSRRFI